MSVRKRKWTTAKGEAKTAWVVDYKDQNGVRALRTFDKQGEAKAFETTMRGEVRDKKHVVRSKSLTVAEAGDEWIKAVTQGRGDRGPAEASTLRQYKQHLKDYIKPMLGTVKLSDLAKPDITRFRTDLLAKLSRAMAKKVLQSLKGILSEMQHQDQVMVNVAATVQIGTGRHKEDVTVPSIADIKAILAKLDELALQPNKRWAEAWHKRRAFLATAIHTGMRASELRGLPWAAVDLKAGTIEVRQRADESGDIGAPKSKAGRRTINIPASLVAILRAWKLRAGGHDLVFATTEGTPESLPNIFNRAWKPIQIEAGVCDPTGEKDEDDKPIMEPRYNFHALRHFHASMLIADNANPKEIQVELGHSSIQITYDLYGHLFEDEHAGRRRQERSERLAGLLG
ncbi:site-specific integrase [Mesorhizobium sp. M2D.F.Ca.ET.225.01.1.1]|uniref:tyrosine-type recombinase/integrase n=1 Tax=unclassified Mesorhizobium TaxID=325217 RepID=UPI000FD46C7D|nr:MULTISPECIES: site-specific integrase [unclassified Mesorhizobium]TGP55763.1 site-specific integrase [Mesorhizobium sp. M2D.F.Ca.ET.226.01.1.1]TGP68221.1 site-specific integrase [Mesorhizobium sp. M2D.F.Ca.ET.225.01.1.1]